MITSLSNTQIITILIILFLLTGYVYYINCENKKLKSNNINTNANANTNTNTNANSNNTSKHSIIKKNKKNNIRKVNKNVSFLLPQTEEKKNIFYLNKNMEYDDSENDDLNVSLLPQGTMFVHP